VFILTHYSIRSFFLFLPAKPEKHPLPDFSVSSYDIPLASLSLIECLTLSISYWSGCTLAGPYSSAYVTR